MSIDATVFVVDDDDAVCNSLRWLFESVRLKVETFSTANDFLAAYQAPRRGCLVLDVRMPGMSGLDFLERLDHLKVDLPVIMLTGHGDIPMTVRAMKSGAVDFFQKPFNNQLLLDSVQLAIERHVAANAEQQMQSESISAFALLSDREMQVARLIAKGKANKVIASELDVSVRTVETHRAKIMSKLKISTVAELVHRFIAYEARTKE